MDVRKYWGERGKGVCLQGVRVIECAEARKTKRFTLLYIGLISRGRKEGVLRGLLYIGLYGSLDFE